MTACAGRCGAAYGYMDGGDMDMISDMKNQPMTFEQGLEELGGLVEALEGDSLTLEESFSAYERGARLAAYLKGLLAQGEKRIAALTESLKEIDISGEVEE